MSNTASALPDDSHPNRSKRPKRDATVSDLNARSKRLIRDWAKQFRASHGRTVRGIVEHGALLNKGKEALGHGNWTKALEAAGLNDRTAQEYMRIANHAVLANPRNFSVLPSARSTLYDLSGLQAEFVQDLLNENRVNPNITRDELAEMVNPTPEEEEPKPLAKKREPKGLTWPTSVDATIRTFFAVGFDCDATDPDEVVWRRDDETIAFRAPQTDSNGFHNRISRGAMVFFPLGQKFVLFYEGERRDEFAAAFGEFGILAVAWGS